MPRRWPLLLLVVALGPAATARAQTAPPPDESDASARAAALFEAAKRLLDAGSITEACRVLEQSYAVEPGGGTLLNLAVCYERAGRWASAAAGFRQALERAEADGRADRAELARRHLVQVEPRVSELRLTIDAALGEPVVTLDGEPWPAARWQGHPLDPGEHELRATAGAIELFRPITVPSEGGLLEVHLAEPPRPEPAPPGPVPPEPVLAAVAPEPPSDGGPAWLLPTGATLLAVGTAGLAVGSGFGIHALSRQEDVEAGCSGAVCTDPAAFEANEDVDRSATVATAALVGGAIAAAGGGTLLLLDVLDEPALAVGLGTLHLRGSF